MATALSAFYPKIRTAALGCPTFVMEPAVREALREFCDKTWCWRHSAFLSVLEDIPAYTLLDEIDLPSNTELLAVVKVVGPWSTTGSELSSGSLTKGSWYRITAYSDQDFTADGADYNTVGTIFQASGTSVSLDSSNKVIELAEQTAEYTAYTYDLMLDEWVEANTPSQDYDLVLTLALQPDLSAATVPDWLYNRHYRAIVSGALAELLAQPGRDWSNIQLADIHAGRFQKEVAAMKRRLFEGYTGQSRRVRMSTFA